MFCPKCGKEIKEISKFCDNCGAPVDVSTDSPASTEQTQNEQAINEQTQSLQTQQPSVPAAPQSKSPAGIKIDKKIIAIACAALVVIIALIITVSSCNNPMSKMNRAISSGKIDEAYGIYVSKLSGKMLNEKTLDKLKDAAEDIIEDYEDGDISYEDAMKSLNDINSLVLLASAPSNFITDARNDIGKINSYNTYMENAEKCYSEKEYLQSMQAYQRALDLKEDSAKAKEGVSKAEEAYRNDIISQAENYISNKDYNSAQSVLNTGLYNLPNDSTLQEKLDGIEDIKIKDIVDEAYDYTEGGDWDGAIELLEREKNQYSGNKAIDEAYRDITEKMPITLKNITTVSSDNINVKKDVIKDRYGNIYSGGVLYNGWYSDSYGLYNLSKKFETFKATAFVGTEASKGQNISISIYADEELVFFKDEISEETQPIEISLDVKDVKTLRIVAKRADDSASRMYVYFANSSFEKVEGADSNE